jgi:lipoprotein signal peptidase
MRTLAIALAVLVADLASKTAAQTGLLAAPWIEASANPDLALGVASASAGMELALGLLTLLVGVVALRRRQSGPLATVAAAFVIGGTLGNLADRLLRGVVRDFIVGPFIVFNVADVALILGIVTLLARAGAASSGVSETAVPQPGDRAHSSVVLLR